MNLTPAAAIDDPLLLAPGFIGPSWDRWRAVLKAAYAEPMTEDEIALFREVADRDPPTRRVRELWVIAGRRSGKDSIASAVATVAGMVDYRPYLRPGERASIMCLASDRNQAKIVHRYIAANFSTVEMLKNRIERETEETIELKNRVEVIVSTNSFRAVRGRNIAVAIFDECGLWKDDSSATPDTETYNAIAPGMALLPGAMLIGISTPYRRAGLLYERWQEFYGTDDDDVLVVRGPSVMFNPTLSQDMIDRSMARDPEAGAAEWMAEWRSDIADYVSREVVAACVADGRFELPPRPGITYQAFADPSGGSSDSFTMCLSHTEGEKAVLDVLREVRPPFSPEAVVLDFATTLKTYGVRTVHGDRYAGSWPAERFSVHGIRYEASERTKNEIYRDALPLLNSRQVELLDHSRMFSQLCSLERRTSRGGRDTVDHPQGGKDDCANAALGALILAKKKPPQPTRAFHINFMGR